MAAIGIRPVRAITASAKYHWWAYGAIAIGMFINVMDQSGINIVLPAIADDFAADIPTVQWVSLGYSLATSAMLMPMGRLSDMIGRKRVYLTGFSIFVALAFVGGMSQNLAVLVAAKIVQGMGSSGVQANSMAFITEVFPDNERGKAMGLYMAIIGIGAISGPIVGGLLVSELGWRSIFFAGIPISLLAMTAAALVLKGRTQQQASRRRDSSFDWVGAALSAGALVAFLLAMTNAWKLGWTSWPIVAGFGSSVLLLAGFIFWELRCPQPMLDLALFRNRVFSYAIGARFASFLGGSAVFFLMPFYLIQGLEYEAREAAFILVPGALGMAILGPLAGRLSDRFGTRWPAAAGMIVLGSRHVRPVFTRYQLPRMACHRRDDPVGGRHGHIQLSEHQRDHGVTAAGQVWRRIRLRQSHTHIGERLRRGAVHYAGNDNHGVLWIRAEPVGAGGGRRSGDKVRVRRGPQPSAQDIGNADDPSARSDPHPG